MKYCSQLVYNKERNTEGEINWSHGKVTVSNPDQMFNWYKLAFLKFLCAVISILVKTSLFAISTSDLRFFFNTNVFFPLFTGWLQDSWLYLCSTVTGINFFNNPKKNSSRHTAKRDYTNSNFNHLTKQRIKFTSIATYILRYDIWMFWQNLVAKFP